VLHPSRPRPPLPHAATCALAVGESLPVSRALVPACAPPPAAPPLCPPPRGGARPRARALPAPGRATPSLPVPCPGELRPCRAPPRPRPGLTLVAYPAAPLSARPRARCRTLNCAIARPCPNPCLGSLVPRVPSARAACSSAYDRNRTALNLILIYFNLFSRRAASCASSRDDSFNLYLSMCCVARFIVRRSILISGCLMCDVARPVAQRSTLNSAQLAYAVVRFIARCLTSLYN
jgi:hypothetical protein